MARPLYCQPTLEQLLLAPARRNPDARFIVAGPQYPESIAWPRNVKRVAHLPPREHRKFYNPQRFTLNVTRAEMIRAGWSPSVHLFEAAACGVPIISDWWNGLDELFAPGREILIARSSADVLRFLREVDADERAAIGERARQRVLGEHTAAQELESYVAERYASASCAHSSPTRRMMSASRTTPPSRTRERSSSTSPTRL
jgi:spore maturation protein CgeB